MHKLQQVLQIWKVLDPAISNVQKTFLKLLKPKYSSKTENVQIPLKGVCAKICAKFRWKNYAIMLLL